MIHDTVKRLQTVLDSVVVLATALAVAATVFLDQVTPALPDGWQDNAVSIGGTVVAVLYAASRAVRRLTEVPSGERGLLPTPGRDHVPPS